ncbi:MAG: type II secretion system F family protein [Acidimicrobiales bacterium]
MSGPAARGGPGGAGGAGTGGARGRGRRARTLDREVREALPELVDLFRLAAGAGMPVAVALVHVAPLAPIPLRPALEDAARSLDRGLPLRWALDRIEDALGTTAGPLVEALARTAATGEPAGPMLAALAESERERRMRAAQEQARRLPVTMLLPLALCILPAAVVLAVVPVLIASLRSLSP